MLNLQLSLKIQTLILIFEILLIFCTAVSSLQILYNLYQRFKLFDNLDIYKKNEKQFLNKWKAVFKFYIYMNVFICYLKQILDVNNIFFSLFYQFQIFDNFFFHSVLLTKIINPFLSFFSSYLINFKSLVAYVFIQILFL